MRIKCLGKFALPHKIRVITGIPRPRYDDTPIKKVAEENADYPEYLELGLKRYSDAHHFKSKKLYEKYMQKSKKIPQRIYDVASKPNKSSKGESLWLYNGKIYLTDRNDYAQEQVRLLIMDFLEKESGYFKKLKRKYDS